MSFSLKRICLWQGLRAIWRCFTAFSVINLIGKFSFYQLISAQLKYYDWKIVFAMWLENIFLLKGWTSSFLFIPYYHTSKFKNKLGAITKWYKHCIKKKIIRNSFVYVLYRMIFEICIKHFSYLLHFLWTNEQMSTCHSYKTKIHTQTS